MGHNPTLRRVLLIDVGNSSTKTRAWSRASGLEQGTSWRTTERMHAAIFDGAYVGSVMASVVPRVGISLREAATLRGLELIPVTPSIAETTSRITGLYDSMGADRVADLMAVAALYPLPALCIDAGSAVTFDLISCGLHYEGGLIVPGPSLMAGALAGGTALLPCVEPGSSEQPLVKGTEQAVAAGSFWGVIGMIDGLLRLFEDRGHAWRSLVVTGGMAHVLTRHIRFDHVIDDDLCFKGMALVWEATHAGPHAR